MSIEENDVNVDSSTTEEEETTEEETTEEESTEEEAEETEEGEKNAPKTVPYERFKEVNDKLKEVTKGQKEKGGEKVSNPSSESDRLDRIELKQDGYPDSVIDSIMELGGPKALKNPLVKRTADALLKEYKAEQASKISSGTRGTPKIKYTADELSKMSSEEMEKVLPHSDKD